MYSHCITLQEVVPRHCACALGQPLRFASETGDDIYDHKCEYFDNSKVIFYLSGPPETRNTSLSSGVLQRHTVDLVNEEGCRRHCSPVNILLSLWTTVGWRSSCELINSAASDRLEGWTVIY